MPVDYKNGKIYTIRNRNDDTLIYVGSTCNTLTKRFNEHKKANNSKKKLHLPFYEIVDGCWDEWYIELHEEYPCENKQQLNRREGQVTREIGTLNCLIAGRTNKERYIDNHDQFLEQQKKYREKNREHIREWDAKYREANREKFREKYKTYDEKRSVKYICECGGSTNRKHQKEHEKTKKHLKYIEENQK